jgi:hypothetical protein
MKYVLSVTIVALIALLPVPSVSAQSPALTNADVSRLVAMRVSDETVIAVIREAKAMQLDLRPLVLDDLAFHGVSVAVIAAMRQSAVPTPTTSSPQTQTFAHSQTLAEASEAAKAVNHSWELSTNLGSTTAAAAPPTLASASEITKSEPARSEGGIATASAQDEKWWRARMSGLRDQLVTDKATCQPIAAKIVALQNTYDSYVFTGSDGTRKINTAAAATIETQVVAAQAEQRKCAAKVALDQSSIGIAEEEARRLGVLPGWLR